MCLYLTKRHSHLVALVEESRWRGTEDYPLVVEADDWQGPPDKPTLREQCIGGQRIGSITDQHVAYTKCNILPDPTRTLLEVVREQRTQREHARLIDHSKALRIIGSSPFQKQLAAQMLSASTVGSGRVFNWFPVPGNTIQDAPFRALLKMRLCIADWHSVTNTRCTCGTRTVGHVTPEQQTPCLVTVAQQPLHGLMCRKPRCAGRVIRRHTAVKDVIASLLKNNMQDLVVSDEPHIREDRDLRADLTIKYQGRLWYVDVQVTSPGTHSQVQRRRTHEIQGAAAEAAYRKKLSKYATVLGARRGRGRRIESVPNFQPFIVETGGFIHPLTVAWLDELLGARPAVLTRVYAAIGKELDIAHGRMLSRFKATVLS
jgi:hypothetical protein